LVGNFQDLSKVNYTQKDYHARLDPCLAWKKDFVANIKIFNYNKFVNSISSKYLYKRSKKDLSKDFWRHVKGEPNKNKTGLQNIAYLVHGQITDAIDNYNAMYILEDIWQEQYHTQFHDYRKLLRAIEYVSDEFMGIWTAPAKPLLNIIDNAYGKFGDINDEIGEYTYYKSNGNKPMAEQTKAKIIKDWAALRAWLKTNDFTGSLTKMIQLLIPH